MKKLNTGFGELEFQNEAVLHFADGIYGFEDVKDYVLIDHDEQGTIMTLQTVDGTVPQFVVLDPFVLIEDYAPVVSLSDRNKMGVENTAELKFLLIAIVGDNYLDTVVNLKSPIIINPATRQATQIFVENESYSMKHRLFKDDGGCNHACD